MGRRRGLLRAEMALLTTIGLVDVMLAEEFFVNNHVHCARVADPMPGDYGRSIKFKIFEIFCCILAQLGVSTS